MLVFNMIEKHSHCVLGGGLPTATTRKGRTNIAKHLVSSTGLVISALPANEFNVFGRQVWSSDAPVSVFSACLMSP